ncbi:Ig-like domain-containing protein [Chryseobacterium taiwanense]|uniref:Fibronectin type-III domain-containing protein n=1 Tax=Chryseobacterium taiwanense TaxID=363331 RepID=A0A0B4DDH1_9FLAO|nr:T9SS type A sorting domain-containing protein [Chryseobacterium taiwanense]KIC62385.1 hypothetical protein RM51_12695 [Chryseobacterium taiwanense]
MKHFYNLKVFKNSRTRNLKTTALCSLFLLGSYASIDAQAKAYTFAQSTSTFTAVTAGTVLATATGTSAAASLYQVTPYDVALPFNFNYNGTVYSSIKVSSNGYITFGTTAPGTSNSTPISSTEAYNGAVSVFGKSLNTFAGLGGITGDIRTEVVGTAPNREMIIQWTNFRPAYSTSTTSAYAFSFQIRLKETSNVINMVYNSGAFAIGSTNVSGAVQIGLRGASSSDYNNRLNASTLAFTSSTPGTDNASTQYTSTTAGATSGMPPAGFTYTWTPPTCFAPVVTTSSSTTNSITVNWTAPTPAPSNYDVYYNATNIAPTSSTPPTQSNITGTSATIGSLSQLTPYYVWVRSNCGSGNYSAWIASPVAVTTLCQPLSLPSTTGATICPGNTAALTASTSAGLNVTWYDAATNGNQVGTGTSFTTPALTATTNYWATASASSTVYVGKEVPVSTTGNNGWSDVGLVFNVLANTTIETVDVYPMGSSSTGTVTVALKNSAGTVLQSKTVNVNVSSTGVLNTIALDFPVSVGTGYRLVVTGQTGLTYLVRESTTGYTYPYTISDIISITSAYTSGASASYYYYFYNWKINTKCESARQQVTATVDAAACLGTSEALAKENVKVHPNPFTEIININKSELVRTAKVLDVSGKLIRTINNPQSSINLQYLSSGLYVLVLEMKDGTQQSIKVIKK